MEPVGHGRVSNSSSSSKCSKCSSNIVITISSGSSGGGSGGSSSSGGGGTRCDARTAVNNTAVHKTSDRVRAAMTAAATTAT